MDSDFSRRVKDQADIVKIVGGYVRLRKAGAQNFSGLCPFHKEKTPSFSVHAGRQFYHCFGCGQSGDVFSFVQRVENLSFPEAVRAVAQKCGIPLPKKDFASPEEAAEHRQRGKLLELHEVATAWFEEQLRSAEGATAREYLTGRGLNAEGIARFRIGYAPDNFHALREKLQSLADTEILRATGLFSWKEQEDGSPGPMYARFRKRVMFPIANEGGRVIAFTARTLESGEKAGPKYLNSPETPLYSKGQVLFNLDKARQAIRNDGGAVLVEGQMDCISVFLAGIPNVIATSGTALTETQVRLLRRHTQNIVVTFDPDNAGQAAAQKSIDLLWESGFEIRISTLDGGFDPDRFIRERGARAYAESLRAAPKYWPWLIDRARHLYPSRDPKSKSEAFSFLYAFIQRTPNKIELEFFIDDAAKALDLNPSFIRTQLKRDSAIKRRDAMATTNPAVERAELKDAATKCRDSLASHTHPLTRAEQLLLMAFSAPRSSECYLVAEGTSHQHQREFAALRDDVREMIAALRARPDGGDPLESLASEEHKRMLAGLFLSIHDAEPQADEVEEAVLAIRASFLEQEQRRLRVAIDQAERAGNMDEALRLTRERQHVTRTLRELE
jgi:DNA primase